MIAYRLMEQQLSKLSTRIVVMGDGGNGKSAICNLLVGRNLFESKRSFNKRVTKYSQTEIFECFQIPIFQIIDTPAFPHVDEEDELRTFIAGFENAFLQDGQYLLIFVIRLNRGEIDCDELAKIRLVHHALSSNKNVNYGIVINHSNPEDEKNEKLRKSINLCLEFKTDKFFYLKTTEEIKLQKYDLEVGESLRKFVFGIEPSTFTGREIKEPRMSISDVISTFCTRRIVFEEEPESSRLIVILENLVLEMLNMRWIADAKRFKTYREFMYDL
jgi:GTPase SAR1 family protein